jgi:CBS domain-containing protein
MRVQDIMSSPAITAGRFDGFKEVVGRMLDAGISGMPVVDDDGHLVGMVSEADLVAKEAYGNRPARPLDVVAEILGGRTWVWEEKAKARRVYEVMTPVPLREATPDEDVRVAAQRLLHVKRLPVIDQDGKVLGVVTRRDVLKSFTRPDADIRADIAARLASPRWAPETAVVDVGVERGIVHLVGSVLHPMDRSVMEAVAWSVPGVVDVREELAAREPDPTLSR